MKTQKETIGVIYEKNDKNIANYTFLISEQQQRRNCTLNEKRVSIVPFDKTYETRFCITVSMF